MIGDDGIKRVGHTPSAARIDQLYVWIAEDRDGSEGILSGYIEALGGTYPLIGADIDRMESLRPWAENSAARQAGMPVRLVRFSCREDIEELPR